MQQHWVEIIKSIAWPVATIIAVLVLRPGLKLLFLQLGPRLSKVGFPGGMSIELVPVKGGGGPSDLLTYAGNILPSAPPSGESALQRMVAQVSRGDYLVIRLGDGKEWLTSRLFLFAVILRKTKGLKFVVFTEETQGARNRYLGSVAVDALRWTLGERYPWLEATYSQISAARQEASQAPSSQLTDFDANQLISDFLDRIRISIRIDDDDILDGRSLVGKLKQESPSAKFILSKANTYEKKAIENSQNTALPTSYITQLINRLILEESLAAETAFQAQDVSKELREAAKTHKDTEISSYTNRMLIENFFGSSIRHLPVSVEVQQSKTRDTSRDWVRLRPGAYQHANDVVWEHARWISGARVERWFAGALIQGSIAQHRMLTLSSGDQRDLVLASSGEVVAIVRDNGDFDLLIDRRELLDRFGKQSAHA